MSTAGLIQVIGKDGRVLKSKTISSHQSGEKIQINILKDISTFEAKQASQNYIYFVQLRIAKVNRETR